MAEVSTTPTIPESINIQSMPVTSVAEADKQLSKYIKRWDEIYRYLRADIVNVFDFAVRRDGSTPMTGDWDVGNFDITGIKHLEAASAQIGTDTDNVTIETDGSMVFVGNGGLAGGSMYNHDTSTIVTIAVISTPTRVPSGFIVGRSKKSTFQNDREHVVLVSGWYDITWQISFTTASANQEIEGFVMINNVINLEATAHRRIATNTDTGSMSGTCSIELVQNDVIALGVQNETSTSNIIVEHANMKFTQVEG